MITEYYAPIATDSEFPFLVTNNYWNAIRRLLPADSSAFLDLPGFVSTRAGD
jgi:hypothetical protein